MRTIICYYTGLGNETNDNSRLNPDRKQSYLLLIVISRVAIPFMLIFSTNILIFFSLRRIERQSTKTQRILLVRHGHHRRITPMIFISSGMLLLTISPR